MNFYPKRRRVPQIMIVSLIDIFAILLIFVIVSTTFKKQQPYIRIKLPESKSAVSSTPKNEPLVLSISKDSEVFFLNRKVEMERLTPLLKELVTRDHETALALNADQDAPFGAVMRVMDSLKEACVKTSLTAFMEKSKK